MIDSRTAGDKTPSWRVEKTDLSVGLGFSLGLEFKYAAFYIASAASPLLTVWCAPSLNYKRDVASCVIEIFGDSRRVWNKFLPQAAGKV